MKAPKFSECTTISIVDKAAKTENQNSIENALKSAIDEANSRGYNTVLALKGEWISGKIHLISHVYLEEGETLLFSDNPRNYLPAVHITWEGMECCNYSPLIYAD